MRWAVEAAQSAGGTRRRAAERRATRANVSQRASTRSSTSAGIPPVGYNRTSLGERQRLRYGATHDVAEFRDLRPGTGSREAFLTRAAVWLTFGAAVSIVFEYLGFADLDAVAGQ